MGRVIQSSVMNKTPKVKFTMENKPDVAGTSFIGQKTAQKDIDKTTVIHEFLLESAAENLLIVVGNQKEGYQDAPVGPGDKVSIAGGYDKDGRPNQIADKLGQVKVGERIKMTYNGKVVNPKSGHKYNDFTVEVL